MENKNSTKTAKYQGVKSGYHAFGIDGLRGTIYVPKGYFDAKNVPATLDLNAPFVAPKEASPDVAALKAEVEALKAQLAAAAPAQPEGKLVKKPA